MTIGESMRRVRTDRGFTQEALSIKSGIGQQNISKYECGGSFPTIINLIPIADALGVSLDELVGRTAPKSEVAKIFEEIEKQIDLTLSVIQKILNAKGGRSNGKTVLISKYDMLIESKKFIAELKKKYTEENAC